MGFPATQAGVDLNNAWEQVRAAYGGSSTSIGAYVVGIGNNRAYIQKV